ncbi:MAG: serine/threonine-protein kinase [Bryobacteraceae bacterium]
MIATIRGQYHLLEKLGSGGMGEVYQARDAKLNRMVAVKVLKPDPGGDPGRRRRFLQEAQAASSLNHPNIVTIYDVVSEGDLEVIIMEYVGGKTLTDVIPRGGLRVPQVINYGLQVADGLAAAHAAGIIHRDLKPGNIMITERERVKILDFGLAKLEFRPDSGDPDATTDSPLTVQGSIVGTLCYMSPEQAQGLTVDARSDMFSFGAVLYEAATGKRAFTGDNGISMLSSVLRDEPGRIFELTPDVPAELED